MWEKIGDTKRLTTLVEFLAQRNPTLSAVNESQKVLKDRTVGRVDNMTDVQSRWTSATLAPCEKSGTGLVGVRDGGGWGKRIRVVL